MKICLIAQVENWRGGIQQYSQNYAEALSRKIEISIIGYHSYFPLWLYPGEIKQITEEYRKWKRDVPVFNVLKYYSLLSVYEVFKLITQKIKANVVDNGKDVVPFLLKFYEGLEGREFENYYLALDDHFSKFKEIVPSKYEKQIEKMEIIVAEQKKQIAKFESGEQEAREKADALYAKYTEVSTILKELNKILEKHTWKEVKDKLKGHKVIKEINAKEKSIVVEL